MFLRCQRWAGRSPTADLSGGQLIAATQDALEEESFALPDATANLGAMKSPDTEQLLALEVDFVILSANVAEHVKLRDFLEESGIPAAYFDVETFEDYLDMLKICTDIMGARIYTNKTVRQCRRGSTGPSQKARGRMRRRCCLSGRIPPAPRPRAATA